jgi:hypothetical protein
MLPWQLGRSQRSQGVLLCTLAFKLHTTLMRSVSPTCPSTIPSIAASRTLFAVFQVIPLPPRSSSCSARCSAASSTVSTQLMTFEALGSGRGGLRGHMPMKGLQQRATSRVFAGASHVRQSYECRQLTRHQRPAPASHGTRDPSAWAAAAAAPCSVGCLWHWDGSRHPTSASYTKTC